MTVSTLASSTIAMGNGVSPSFNFDFIADSAQNIEVIFTDIDGTATTLSPSQYTLIINPAAVGQLWGIGGTVVYPIAGPPIVNGTSLTISRIVPFTQVITISNQGDFAPQVIEEALDTLCFEIQQVSARTGQFRGTWITDTVYNFGDIAVDGSNGNNSGNFYMCIIANTSNTWSTDLADGDWTLVIQSVLPSTPLPLSVPNGGTGTSSFTQGDMVYADTTSTLAKLAKNTNPTRYISNTGISNNPAWTQIDLANGVAGSLPVANGGTGGITSTGTGAVVLANTPTLVTPILGVASCTSINFGQDALNYYDEGTFVPVAIGSSSPGVGTYGTQQGKFTRIGNCVFYYLVINWSAHTGTGNLLIGGLPFTIVGAVPSSVYFSTLTVGAGNQLSATASPTTTNIDLSACPVAGGSATPVAMDTAVGQLIIGGFYYV